MLTELLVRDLGVIDELSLVLGEGMTVVTGETGAGKTLVVGAIDLLTGGRADASLVRPGATEAEIQGRFVRGDDELIVRRVIPREGRSRVYINGHLATVSALTDHGVDLIDLHGQHAHQSLLKPAVQRAALDQFGGVDTGPLATLLDELRAVDADLSELGGDERSRAREIDLLRHQLAEIEAAGVEDGDEDGRLDEEESLLADAGAHREAARTAVAALDGDGPAAASVAEALQVLDVRSPFSDLVSRLRGVQAELADIAAEARDRAEQIDDDPERLELLRHRRAMLRELRRKYGETLEEVVAFGVESSDRLAELSSFEERANTLDDRKAGLLAELTRVRAEVLSVRTEAAPRFAAAVEKNLKGLAMAGARLEVTVGGEAGDDITIRLAANAGHDPQPLSKVASGGELARAMLALRLVLTSGPPTLVFDEVDAGIGGEVAHTVGANLAALTSDHQVLVVTHLAQVAACADHHVAVSKREVDGVTVSAAHLLADDARIIELSRMLSGSPDSSAAREHAEELINSARLQAASRLARR
ncbi:MAG: DNA repair protein RecN [Actinobacteria bacterium]|nr:DNA repair protein RecN [Actinomycetota bacterium]